MSRLIQSAAIRRLFAAAVVIGGLSLVSSTAQACGSPRSVQPRCYWKTVTEYVSVEQPCVYYVTKYDHCGRSYRVKVVTYKTVRVPVQTRVRVCY